MTDDAREVLSRAGFGAKKIEKLLSKRTKDDRPYVRNPDLTQAAHAFRAAGWDREDAGQALGVGHTTIFTLWQIRL